MGVDSRAMDTTTFLLVNAYFPCDNHSKTSVGAEYQAALDFALCLWIESDADVVILGGDLNTDISRNNAHSHALNQLAHDMNSDLAWRCSEAQQIWTPSLVLCKICSDAGTSFFPVSRSNKLSSPKWSERMKLYKDDALFWDSVWKSCDKPRDGIVFDLWQNTKREYHYALRRYKREERALRRKREWAQA
ncbi:hypothetical protein CAPTEDRAFT_217936 [Capitella teleta]|uniref:Endonuclease/exonuclease/phosphatase domain-containing protein n=1 Tax=Capitella teleta TaxID=283909 RepID=R7UBF1_CAPTE|nr:hypothetical protein CAPTEDRAFT_217936 [Capitella teleta]|eukprot:ELU03700.1 hypothetical protein CAPTEDRAFT_217936 [Capitella teleta]